MGEYEQEKKEHPWASPNVIRKIVADHERMKNLKTPAQRLAEKSGRMAEKLREAIQRRKL